MTVTKTPAQVVEGSPADPTKKPVPREMRKLLDEMRVETATAAQGISILANADLATTADVTLSGEQTIDGTLTSESRLLVKDQSDATENGIYVTSSGAWTRATDADADAEIAAAYVYVDSGSANGDTAWRVVGSPEIGVDDVVFGRFTVQPEAIADTDDVAEGSNNLYATLANIVARITGASAKTTLADADLLPMVDSEDSDTGKKITWSNVKAGVWTSLGALVAGGTGKATPADADTLPLSDSAASNATKKLTIANLKASVFTGLGGLISGGTNKATLADADEFPLADSAASSATKALSWSALKSNTWTALGALISGGTDKSTLVDADSLPVSDSEASGASKKATFAGIKSGVWAGLGALISGGTAKATPVTADFLAIGDSESANATKKATLASLPVSTAQATADAAVATDSLARLSATIRLAELDNPNGRAMDVTDKLGNSYGYLSLESDWTGRRLVTTDPAFEGAGRIVPLITQDNGGELLAASRVGDIVVHGLEIPNHPDNPRRYPWAVEGLDGTVFAAVDRSGILRAKDIILEDDSTAEDAEVIDLAFPPELWLISGYDLTIYPETLMAPGVYDSDVEARFHSVRQSDQTVFATGSTHGIPLRIEGDKCGPYSQLQMRERGLSEAMQIDLDCTVAAADALDGKAVNVLALGDSLIESNFTATLYHALTALGATPSFIGDITTVEVGARTGTDTVPAGISASPGSLYSEGRGGTEAADWTYANTNDLSPVSNFATYNALSSSAKEDYNPFLRASTGGDPAGRIKNGYIFDPATYFTGTGNTPPEVWVINLGRNDVSQQTQATALEQIEDGINIICQQIRDYDADALIIWSLPPYSIEHDAAKRAVDHLARRKVIETINDLADDKIICAPLWAFVDQSLGFRTSTSSTDSETDVPTVTHADTVHPWLAGNRQAAWGLAPIIAAHAALFSAA